MHVAQKSRYTEYSDEHALSGAAAAKIQPFWAPEFWSRGITQVTGQKVHVYLALNLTDGEWNMSIPVDLWCVEKCMCVCRERKREEKCL